MESSPDPPFNETYKNFFNNNNIGRSTKSAYDLFEVDECELPLIDLNKLNMGEMEREECKKEIEKASREWGFFQVVNHGISREILEKMRFEQVKMFKRPFQEKIKDNNLNFLAGSYRWGTPSATCLTQLSWSEAFHVPLDIISGLQGGPSNSNSNTLRYNFFFLCLANYRLVLFFFIFSYNIITP